MYQTRFGKLVKTTKTTAAKPTVPTPDPAKKGKRDGNCNMTACQKPGATHYSIFTRAWYCVNCAHAVNVANRADIERMYGVRYAVFRPSDITAEDRAKLEAANLFVPV